MSIVRVGREGLQEPAVVRHEQDGAVVAAERALELLDRLDVEVVRRLVEDEAVDAAGGQQCETGAGALARRERRRPARSTSSAPSPNFASSVRAVSASKLAEDLEQRSARR